MKTPQFIEIKFETKYLQKNKNKKLEGHREESSNNIICSLLRIGWKETLSREGKIAINNIA